MDAARQAVLVPTTVDLAADATVIRGYDFNDGVDFHALLESFSRTGFQASNVGAAIVEIKRMASRARALTPSIYGNSRRSKRKRCR